MNGPVTITELQIQNFKVLRAVRIDATGNMIVIGGKNGAGKSSVLDGLAAVLGGKKLCPSSPIRKGQETATIRCKLEADDRYVVERKFYYSTTKPGEVHSTVSIKASDGNLSPSPQGILNDLLGDGNLGFDPLAFTRMQPKQQADQLRTVVGIDFTELDAKRAKLYGNRRDNNLLVKATKARVQDMAYYPDAADGPVDVSALQTELRSARDTNTAHLEAEAQVKLGRQSHGNLCSQLGTLVASMEQVQKSIAVIEREVDEALEKLTIRDAALEELPTIDTDSIEKRVSEAAYENSKIEANASRVHEAKALTEQEEKSKSFTLKIDAIDAKKAKILDGAEWPVAGLAFGADGVTFNGLPFEQASQSEQIRVSVSMSFAAHPDLPLAIIRDGSLLDPESLAMVAEIAAEHDAQVWIERVGDGAECSLVLEDGEVIGVADPTEAIQAEQDAEDAAEEKADAIP